MATPGLCSAASELSWNGADKAVGGRSGDDGGPWHSVHPAVAVLQRYWADRSFCIRSFFGLLNCCEER